MNNSMKASISYYEETFVGQDDFEILRVGNRYVVQASQTLPDGGKHYINFRVPVDIPGDGSPVTLSLVLDPIQPDQARGEYIRLSAGGSGHLLGSRSGKLTLSLDAQTQQMKGDFQFEVRLGDTPVNISAGSFDITGITDGVADTTGSGTFTATSAWGDFRADEVSIELKELPLDPVRYWEVVGRMPMDTGVPPQKAHIGLFIKEHVKAGPHDLKDNPDVWVTCFRPHAGYLAQAAAGTLTLTSLPGTGHAKGTLAADFEENGKTVHVKGEFDIRSATRHG
ncbi:hypothetical protein [Pseudomonas sp. NPDC089534]|uniref:hypothetical protein n=1 Tax=Pseudomonas sp. NPDC089534 TaxID=3364468 RepID=UPI00381A3445